MLKKKTLKGTLSMFVMVAFILTLMTSLVPIAFAEQTNIALGKPVFAALNPKSGIQYPERMTDGKLVSNDPNNDVIGYNQVWAIGGFLQVDLGASYKISQISLGSSTYTNLDATKNIKIYASNESLMPYEKDGVTNFTGLKYIGTTGSDGIGATATYKDFAVADEYYRYIVVGKDYAKDEETNQIFNIAEIAVYSDGTIAENAVTTYNVALGKPVRFTGYTWGGTNPTPAHYTDGITNKYTTTTFHQGYIEIDLGNYYKVTDIELVSSNLIYHNSNITGNLRVFGSKQPFTQNRFSEPSEDFVLLGDTQPLSYIYRVNRITPDTTDYYRYIYVGPKDNSTGSADVCEVRVLTDGDTYRPKKNIALNKPVKTLIGEITAPGSYPLTNLNDGTVYAIGEPASSSNGLTCVIAYTNVMLQIDLLNTYKLDSVVLTGRSAWNQEVAYNGMSQITVRGTNTDTSDIAKMTVLGTSPVYADQTALNAAKDKFTIDLSGIDTAKYRYIILDNMEQTSSKRFSVQECEVFATDQVSFGAWTFNRSNNDITANITVENNTAENFGCMMIAASYDSNNALISIKAEPKSVDAETSLSLSTTVQSTSAPAKVKAYLWQAYTSLSPLVGEGLYESGQPDFIVDVEAGREIKILQLTDTQIIDSSQARDPLADKETWAPEKVDELLFNQIDYLVSETNPDLILITGDLVYGSYDDSGASLTKLINHMESFGIPWAPIFGNHENESAKGVEWQCQQLINAENCLFKVGNVTGNGNYTIGITQGNELVRVIYMLDTNGCVDASDPKVPKTPGIYDDQIEWLDSLAKRITDANSKQIPSFAAFHIPVSEFQAASIAAGYQPEADNASTIHTYTIGEGGVTAQNGDFGTKGGSYYNNQLNTGILGKLKNHGFDGVFVGHKHTCNTSVLYDGIRWTFGTKTGKYDSYDPAQQGGTLITVAAGGETFEVSPVYYTE